MNLEAADAGAGWAADAPAEDDILARCQAGEQEAFGVLVERYRDVVFRIVCLMTNDRPLAEDLTQESFVNAWRGIRSFRIGSPFRPWLIRIAINRVQSHRRRRQLVSMPLSTADTRAPSDEPSPERRAESAATREEVRRALASLPDDQRHVLVLRYYSELSVPEIARATGWREGTVKSRLHRALGRMRSLLEPMDER